jgi:hypothetical protein
MLIIFVMNRILELMKIILTAIFVISYYFLAAIPDSTFVAEIDSLRKIKAYQVINKRINKQLEVSPDDLWLNYQNACYFSLQGDSLMAGKYLMKSIELNKSAKDIFTDTDFENLHVTKIWRVVEDSLTQRYLRLCGEIREPELSVELWRMGIEDQRFRTLRRNYKKEWTSNINDYKDPFQIAYRERHERREKRLKKIIRKYGWPTYSMVGRKASDAAFFIVQHSNLKFMKKSAPKMENAVMAGEASGNLYAMLVDRILMIEGKRQLYGTQLRRDGNMVDGVMVYGPYYLWPVQDEMNLNKRREEVGLITIEEYLKYWDLEYVYNPAFDSMTIEEIIEYHNKTKK